MATGTLSITYSDFTANTVISSSEIDTDFDEIMSYINNRNDGTDEWQVVKVTGTTSNPVVITGNQSRTEVSIDNTASDGDPQLTYKLSGTAICSLGIDDSDSDALCLAFASTLNGTNTLRITQFTLQTSLSNSGNPVSWTLGNTSNTTSSSATHFISVAGSSASDCWTNYVVSGVTNYSIGIDNSDSDAFCLTAAATLNGTNLLRIISTTLTSTIPFLMPAGTNSAPSVAWSDDSGQTGMYRTGANKIGFSSGTTLIFEITNSATISYAALNPDGNKTIDSGGAANAWDDMYADDFNNVADIPFFDFVKDIESGKEIPVDDLEVVKAIKPLRDVKGNLCFNENGHAYWDDNTLPTWIFHKDKKDRSKLVRDADGKPWISMKVLAGLSLGAVGQLIKSVENLEQKVASLEKLNP